MEGCLREGGEGTGTGEALEGISGSRGGGMMTGEGELPTTAGTAEVE